MCPEYSVSLSVCQCIFSHSRISLLAVSALRVLAAQVAIRKKKELNAFMCVIVSLLDQLAFQKKEVEVLSYYHY